jgi:hypothetical protein
MLLMGGLPMFPGEEKSTFFIFTFLDDCVTGIASERLFFLYRFLQFMHGLQGSAAAGNLQVVHVTVDDANAGSLSLFPWSFLWFEK